jgi:SnoaL-like polyketide cyclase
MRCRERHTEVIAMFDLETNKAIALRLAEVFNGRRLDLLEDVLHSEFRGRGISAFPPGGPEVGPSARRKLYEMFYQAIPDARAEVLNVVAEGDKVVVVDRFGGTHRGELFGRPGTGTQLFGHRDGRSPCHLRAASLRGTFGGGDRRG